MSPDVITLLRDFGTPVAAAIASAVAAYYAIKVDLVELHEKIKAHADLLESADKRIDRLEGRIISRAPDSVR